MEQFKKGDTFPVHIHQVVDGDVLEVSAVGFQADDEGRILVRLYGIDTPEPTQRYWIEAKSHLERLVRNGRFLLKVVDIEEGSVIVGDVYRNSLDDSISQDMVRAGWAYLRRDCIGDALGLQRLEQQAFFNGVGVWRHGGDEVRPWVYREMVREEEERRRRLEKEEESERKLKEREAERLILDEYYDYNRKKDRVGALKALISMVAVIAVLVFIEYLGHPLPYSLAYLLLLASFQSALVAVGLIFIYTIGSPESQKVWATILGALYVLYAFITPNRVLDDWDIPFADEMVSIWLIFLVLYFVKCISNRMDWDEWKWMHDKSEKLKPQQGMSERQEATG